MGVAKNASSFASLLSSGGRQVTPVCATNVRGTMTAEASAPMTAAHMATRRTSAIDNDGRITVMRGAVEVRYDNESVSGIANLNPEPGGCVPVHRSLGVVLFLYGTSLAVGH